MATASTDGVETLLIGLDAACPDVLEPLFDRGIVPNLAAVFERGVSAPLESQIPPWTASAWPSLYTGVNPGKHGVFGFLRFDGYDWDVVNASHVSAWSLWELLGRSDARSVVVNVPVTHPPVAFPGALVPGYVAPEDPECRPPGLLDDVRENVGEYRVYPNPVDDGRDARIDEYRRLVRMRGEAFRYLADRFDPAFGFVQFQQTDTVFHELPGDEEAVASVYAAVDEQVGDILDAVDPATVVVASDHGMGPYGGYEFRVNDFLSDAGYVRTERGGGMPAWDDFGSDGAADGSGLAEWPARLAALLARAGVTSQRIETVLRRLGLDDFAIRHVPRSVVRAGAERVDFASSMAYMRTRTELGVRLNLAGREPDGSVPAERYEEVRRKLIDALASVRTPDGDFVFEEVAPREAHFHGPEADRAVDIVTVPATFDQFLSASIRHRPFDDPSEPWNHKMIGVVAAAGDAVDASVDPGNPHLFDVAPTVLATLGVPRDERMDGDVMPFVSSAGERAYPPYEGRPSTATDDGAVEERLEQLGYLE